MIGAFPNACHQGCSLAKVSVLLPLQLIVAFHCLQECILVHKGFCCQRFQAVSAESVAFRFQGGDGFCVGLGSIKDQVEVPATMLQHPAVIDRIVKGLVEQPLALLGDQQERVPYQAVQWIGEGGGTNAAKADGAILEHGVSAHIHGHADAVASVADAGEADLVSDAGGEFALHFLVVVKTAACNDHAFCMHRHLVAIFGLSHNACNGTGLILD